MSRWHSPRIGDRAGLDREPDPLVDAGRAGRALRVHGQGHDLESVPGAGGQHIGEHGGGYATAAPGPAYPHLTDVRAPRLGRSGRRDEGASAVAYELLKRYELLTRESPPMLRVHTLPGCAESPARVLPHEPHDQRGHLCRPRLEVGLEQADAVIPTRDDLHPVHGRTLGRQRHLA